MGDFNFAYYAKAIQAGAPSLDPTNTVKIILAPIIDREDVLNEKGAQYNITSKEALEWWNEETNIPPNICNATRRFEVVTDVKKYFAETILEKTILPQREANTLEYLRKGIEADTTIPQSTIIQWQELLDEDDLSGYLAETFLYAITVPNDKNKENKGKKKRKIKSPEIKADVEDFTKMLGRLPKPTQIAPPEELADHELKYVSQLCAAYSEDAGHTIIREDIPSTKYNSHFQRQRKDYYRAESVRQAARDTFSDEESDVFADLEDETYAAIVDVYEELEAEPALTKAKEVIKAAGNAPLNRSILTHIPGWIGAEEKKGTCHVLVNEERIKWVDDNEQTV